MTTPFGSLEPCFINETETVCTVFSERCPRFVGEHLNDISSEIGNDIRSEIGAVTIEFAKTHWPIEVPQDLSDNSLQSIAVDVMTARVTELLRAMLPQLTSNCEDIFAPAGNPIEIGQEQFQEALRRL